MLASITKYIEVSQVRMLEEEFCSWKVSIDQIDVVLILGLRL
jgi:hypothetical protein